MSVVLGANNYGKSEVRLVKVDRGTDRHELHDLTVDVALSGEFDAAHVRGDNTGLLATDTMRNTVYALARQHPIDSPESFGGVLVNHFLEAGPTVTGARVRVVEHPWARLGSHPHAFERASGGQHVATVTGDGTELTVEAGIDDLLVLKTTGSGWEGYLHEQYTSLKETADRIMATVVTARWSYSDARLDFAGRERRRGGGRRGARLTGGRVAQGRGQALAGGLHRRRVGRLGHRAQADLGGGGRAQLAAPHDGVDGHAGGA